MDFSYLKKVDVKEETTVEYSMNQLPMEPVPVLIMKPATEANKAYFNAVLRNSGNKVSSLRTGKITVKMSTEAREEDRGLYPKHIIVGWKNVPDINGEMADFTEENCAKFVAALPDWVFDDIRNYATKPANFVDTVIDIQAKARD